jgi:hypothetical protein
MIAPAPSRQVLARVPMGVLYAPFKLDLPGPYDYWECEEDSFPVLDSMSQVNFTSGSLNRVAGKIGYGLALDSYMETGTTTRFQFSGSFTIRFWYYEDGSLSQLSLLANDAGDESFRIRANNAPGDNGIIFSMFDSGNTGFDLNPTSGTALGAGWHRVIVWYEHGVGMGAKIDNDASVTLAQTGGIYATPGNRLYMHVSSTPASGCKIDEISIWNQILTESEMLADWNGGSGRTYPW